MPSIVVLIVGLGILQGSSEIPAHSAPIVIERLTDMPNTTVRYYDVSGSDVTAVNRAIARQRPKGSSGKPVPASTDWSVKVDFDRRTIAGQCKVVAAQAQLEATADLPRHTEEELLQPALRNRWRSYVGELEQSSLATLVFVHSNLLQVEQAMLNSECDGAQAAGAAAIHRLRQLATQQEAGRHKRLSQSNQSVEFRSAPPRDLRNLCKNVTQTGSRLRTFWICMPISEWERMNADGEAFTREVQNKSISGKYF